MNTLNYKRNNNIYNINYYIKKPKNIQNTNYLAPSKDSCELGPKAEAGTIRHGSCANWVLAKAHYHWVLKV